MMTELLCVACRAKHKKMTSKTQKPRFELPVNGTRSGVLTLKNASLPVKSAYKISTAQKIITVYFHIKIIHDKIP